MTIVRIISNSISFILWCRQRIYNSGNITFKKEVKVVQWLPLWRHSNKVLALILGSGTNTFLCRACVGFLPPSNSHAIRLIGLLWNIACRSECEWCSVYGVRVRWEFEPTPKHGCSSGKLSVVCLHSSGEHDVLGMPLMSFFKIDTNVYLDSRMNWFDSTNLILCEHDIKFKLTIFRDSYFKMYHRVLAA